MLGHTLSGIATPVVAVATLAVTAGAAEIYIATNGNDANPGVWMVPGLLCAYDCGPSFSLVRRQTEKLSCVQDRVDALRQAFPNYGIETVLVLGKACRGQQEATGEFDHVLLAEDVFL